MSLFRRNRPPTIPDDADLREASRASVEERAAKAEAMAAEILPTAEKLADALVENHFAQRVKQTYQLRRPA